MKCYTYLLVGFMASMNFCIYAMEQQEDESLLLASTESIGVGLYPLPTLKAVDEAHRDGDTELKRARKDTYKWWLSTQPSYDFEQIKDSDHISLQNKKLTTLSAVEGNTIVTIFHVNPIRAAHVHTIDVSDNNLTELPLKKITKLCTHLQAFKASNNNISDVSMPHSSKQHHCMTELDLRNNKLVDIDLTRLLNAYTALKTIRLSSNPLTTVTWDGSWERENKESYPDIYLANTQLPEAEKAHCVARYKRALTMPYHCTVGMGSFVGGMAGVVVGILPAAITYKAKGTTTLDERASIMAQATCGAGATGATLGCLATYWWYRPELQLLKDEAELHVFFDDL